MDLESKVQTLEKCLTGIGKNNFLYDDKKEQKTYRSFASSFVFENILKYKFLVQ